jgi:riboflavin synthase
MFTGLVTAIGQVSRARRDDEGLELVIDAPYKLLELGESIAVDGACLTVKGFSNAGFVVHIVTTSLDRTAFGTYVAGRRVNLERALRVGDRMGGHLVQGHVDGVGLVLHVKEHEDARLIDIKVPNEVSRVSVPLGSVTVDGVSLTVNAIPEPGVIQISLIPFTLEHTTLGERRPADAVHVEADVLGKYVEGMLRPHLARLPGNRPA